MVVPTKQAHAMDVPPLKKPLSIISNVTDLDGVILEYAGDKWNTGSYVGKDNPNGRRIRIRVKTGCMLLRRSSIEILRARGFVILGGLVRRIL